MSHPPILLFTLHPELWECCQDLSRCFSARVPASIASLAMYLLYP
jgi:hypothetical protein